MTDWTQLFSISVAFLFPIVGGVSLIATKLASGEAKRLAESHFLAALMVVTLVTLRTVATCDDAWLVHTLTLALMVIGALALPSYESSMAVEPAPE